MRTITRFFVACIILTGCDKAPTPTAPYSSQKPVDIAALGGLLKGQWFSFFEVGVGDHRIVEISLLEVDTRSGHPDQFDYRIIRVFDEEIDLESGRMLAIAYIRNDEKTLERGNILFGDEMLAWETIEEGWLRPIQDNGHGHIVFDKRSNVSADISIIGFRIYTDQSVVVWDDELVFRQWDVPKDVRYPQGPFYGNDLFNVLNDRQYIRCAPQTDLPVCGYEF